MSVKCREPAHFTYKNIVYHFLRLSVIRMPCEFEFIDSRKEFKWTKYRRGENFYANSVVTFPPAKLPAEKLAEAKFPTTKLPVRLNATLYFKLEVYEKQLVIVAIVVEVLNNIKLRPVPY